jgi:hypothetical protein
MPKHMSSKFFRREFTAALQEFAGSEDLSKRCEALSKQLQQTKCGAGYILMLLHVYCSSHVFRKAVLLQPQIKTHRLIVQQNLDDRKRLARRLDDKTKSLQRIAGQIKKISDEISLVALDVSNEFGGHAWIFAQLDEVLSCLAETSKMLRGLSFKTAPMYALLQMVHFMYGADDENINYDELALLLEVGYTVFGVTKTVDTEDARHSYKRAKLATPDWAKKWRERLGVQD